jgi:ABC-type bacteriocin/lantibiotic exporter with double-glycine peptidase domain
MNHLPHYRQEQPNTCAVACLRMMAAFYGIEQSESALAQLCGTTFHGTTAEEVAQAAQQLGLQAEVREEDEHGLSATIAAGQRVLVFLWLLPNAERAAASVHAVVVTALDAHTVTFIDPADGLEHIQDRATFLADWQRAFGISILITRP